MRELISNNTRVVQVLVYLTLLCTSMQTGIAQPDAQFEFTYDEGVPEEYIDAFEYSLSVLSGYFNSDEPITAHVKYDSLDASIGAKCSPNYNVALTSTIIDLVPLGSPLSNYWNGEVPVPTGVIRIPAALHNSLAGSDQNGFTKDMVVTMNSNPAVASNYSAAIPPDTLPSSDLSLVNTIIHEVIHGLGFVAGIPSMARPAPTFCDDTVNFNFDPNLAPTQFSSLLQYGDSYLPERLLDVGNPNAAIRDTVTGIHWFGEFGIDGTHHGIRPEICSNLRCWGTDPSVSNCTDSNGCIDRGSSLSHLDTVRVVENCDTVNYFPVMFFSGTTAQPITQIDPISLGIMQDIGWSIDCTNPGCTMPGACNYDFMACPKEGLFDDECVFGDLAYLPPIDSLPKEIKYECSECSLIVDAGYVLAENPCLQHAIESVFIENQFGNNSTLIWTAERQLAYECCLNTGCTDENACNYENTACTNDGSCFVCDDACITMTSFDLSGDGWDGGSWLISEQGGSVYLADGTVVDGSFENTQNFCLPDGCYELVVLPGNDLDEMTWQLSGLPNRPPLSPDPSSSSDGTFLFTVGVQHVGCTDVSACNYNPIACEEPFLNLQNPGQSVCVFPTCGDENACNYQPCNESECTNGTCYDNTLCIYGEDNSQPSYFTEVTWFAEGTIQTEMNDPFGGSFVIDEPFFQELTFYTDLTFLGQTNTDGPLSSGTWTTCNHNFSFFDGSYEYRGTFPEQGTILSGQIYEGENPVGVLISMQPANASYGCTDEQACNYSEEAQIHEENYCAYEACTDPIACNFTEGECVLDECVYNDSPYNLNLSSYNIAVDLNCDDTIEEQYSVEFTSDTPLQTNHTGPFWWLDARSSTCGNTLVIEALTSNGSYALFNLEILGSGTLSSVGTIEFMGTNGCVSVTPVTPGCTDALACNFNPEANENDGTCIPSGCQDPNACNFNPDAGCTPIDGCTYSTNNYLFNYSDWLIHFDYLCDGTTESETIVQFNENGLIGNIGDFSLCWPNITMEFTDNSSSGSLVFNLSGTFDAITGNSQGNFSTSNGSSGCFVLEPAIYGCTDASACNYNPIANYSNENECQYGVGDFDLAELDWQLFYPCGAPEGEVLNFQTIQNEHFWVENQIGLIGSYGYCNNNLQLFNEQGLFFDGLWDNQNSFVQSDPGETCIEIRLGIGGCTYPEASNYNPQATFDDGTCVYSPFVSFGCTDASACNYDSEASEDDGSCDYSCLGCTDPTACNFLPEATADDGTCLYLSYPYCDCGSDEVFDAVGVCGGDCQNDLDEDGICDNIDGCVGTIDACGVCNGPGAIYECGCTEIPQGECDCDGNIAQPYCSDPAACNFFPIEDGCVFDDPSFCQYNDVDLDGICDDVDDCVSEYNCVGCGTCQMGFNINDTLSGGEYSPNMYALASGEITGVEISLLYNALNSNSWPGDMLVEIQKPSGECIEFGGFDFSECPNSIGNYQEVYPSTWAATTPTDLFEATVPFDNLEFVDGEGFWSVRVANGWSSSLDVHYIVLIKVNGLCPVDQSPESISNVLCGPGTMFDFITNQCLPINTCQSDLDGDGIVTTSDLLLFLSDYGLYCP